MNEIQKNINHLFLRRRNKRGAIDGLGSIIKFITGDLDGEDGKRIEESIKVLKENQENLNHEMNTQASLMSKTIEVFNKTISKIVINQIPVETKINQVQTYAKDTQKRKIQM